MSEFFPFEEPMFRKLSQDNPATYMFFQRVWENLDVLELFSIVLVPEASGADYILDKFKIERGESAFFMYYARSGVNMRAGIIMEGWNSDGTLPIEHAERDIYDIGATTDLSFSFDYVGGKVRWKSTSTATYRIKALRILL